MNKPPSTTAVSADAAVDAAFDNAARTRALDTSSSFIVQAPAGSGKTELLIRRILFLLLVVEQPEQIVAITFTRKAAAEMRERIRKALQQAANNDPVASDFEQEGRDVALRVLQRDRELQWGLIANPQRLGLQTIDSLCAQLTRALPATSGMGTPLAADDHAQELYRSAALQTLQDGLDESDESGQAVRRLLAACDNQLPRLQTLIADMLGNRDQWGRLLYDESTNDRDQLEAALSYMIEQRLQRAVDLLPLAVDQRVVDLAAYAAFALRALNDTNKANETLACQLEQLQQIPAAVCEDLPAWQALAKLIFTESQTVRKSVTKKQGFPAKTDAKKIGLPESEVINRKAEMTDVLNAVRDSEEFLAALAQVMNLPDAGYSDQQWQVLEDLFQVLGAAMVNLVLEFDANARCDFTQISISAIQALGTDDEPTDLALALDYRIRHLLVDEFQDTSNSQFDLFAKLISGWEPGDGRSFFAVGDPMQSIYRFRDAEVALFAKAQQEGIAHLQLEPLQLSVNFRSTATVVGWCNRVFGEIFPNNNDRDTGAVTFSRSSAFKSDSESPDSTVCWHTVMQDSPMTVADEVAATAQKALQENPQGSVAILVRSRGNLTEMFQALRHAGVACRAVEMESLAGRPVVSDLRSLTFALLFAHDRIAWMSLLRAPWCALSLDELHAIAELDRYQPVWNLLLREFGPQAESSSIEMSAQSRSRLTNFIRIMQPAVERAQREQVIAWVESCWLQLGGPVVCADVSDIDAAEVAVSALMQLEESGELRNRGRVHQQLESLFAPARIPNGPHVQVMTIHKSKGLEFNTVLLPYLDRRSRQDGGALLNWFETLDADGDPLCVLAPLDTRLARKADKEKIGHLIRQFHAERERNETLRLLYVAATRAREALHLFATLRQKADGDWSSPGTATLLGQLWPAEKEHVCAAVPPINVDSEAAFVTEAQDGDAVSGSAPARKPMQSVGKKDGILNQTASSAAEIAVTGDQLFRLPEDWQMPQALSVFQWPELLAEGEFKADAAAEPDAERPEFLWAGVDAPAIGTVVHRQLQLICQRGVDFWTQASDVERGRVLQQSLQAEGLTGDRLKAATNRVELAIDNCLADTRGRWLLDGSHVDGSTEKALTAWLDGEIQNIIIDRMFVDQGVRWIVDYKTGDHRGGDLQGFLDREQERYQPQLERYARIVSVQHKQPIMLGLYFPLLQQWRAWEPSIIVT